MPRAYTAGDIPLKPAGRSCVLASMDLLTTLAALVTALATALTAPLAGPVEHRIEQTFTVAPGSLVAIDLRGGSIDVRPGEGRTVRIVLIQRVRDASGREAERVRADARVEITQNGDVVRLFARGPSGLQRFWQPRLEMRAEAWVPPDVGLALDTAGGAVTVTGARTAAIEASTAGGRIRIDGSGGPVRASTSGGAIQVGVAGGSLHADTSGGSITIGRVDAAARDIRLRTSGGSIRVGIDPRARLAIDAATSGGRVTVEGLPLVVTWQTRSRVVARLNDGGAPLEASTSGGSIRIAAVGSTTPYAATR